MNDVYGSLKNGSLIEALNMRLRARSVLTQLEFSHLRNSALAGSLHIFYDDLKRPIGYVACAMTNRATLDRLLRYQRLPIYPYEWEEGRLCLILDIAITGIGRWEALNKLRQFILGHRVVVYAKKSGKIRVLLRWNGRMHRWAGKPIAK